jgi:hypothetical protein
MTAWCWRLPTTEGAHGVVPEKSERDVADKIAKQIKARGDNAARLKAAESRLPLLWGRLSGSSAYEWVSRSIFRWPDMLLWGAGFPLGVIGHSHVSDQFDLIRTTGQTFFERRDGALNVFAARCLRPSKDRIVAVEGVRCPRSFLFGSDITIEDLRNTIKIIDKFADLRYFP